VNPALHRLLAAAAALTAIACNQGQPTPPATLSVAVRPLDLADVGDALWTIRIYNGDPEAGGQLVASVEDLSADRYGDGRGAISYVAPCDAATGTAYVRLWLEGLEDEDGAVIPIATYQNPTPLTKTATCAPNTDTPVAFNVTVMRQAEQGFFDIAVNFTDIFCSAKFDCLDDNDDPIELLHNPSGGGRDQTMVLGFACTSGAGQTTWLHMSDVHVECAGTPSDFWMSPAGDSGNRGPITPVFYQTAIYHGNESLEPYDKCYWNMAFGVSGAAPPNCTLIVDATASDASWVANGGRSPDDTIYPYVHFEIPFTDLEGDLACGRHAMNADTRVTTRYSDFDGVPFPFEAQCGATTPTDLGRVACSANVQGVGAAAATFTPSPSGVSVAFGASRSTVYTLPDGLRLDGCCLSPCCVE